VFLNHVNIDTANIATFSLLTNKLVIIFYVKAKKTLESDVFTLSSASNKDRRL
jgi:hypothetical protein